MKKGSRNTTGKVSVLTPIVETKVQSTSVNLVEDLSEGIDSPENAYLEKNFNSGREMNDFEEDDRIM